MPGAFRYDDIDEETLTVLVRHSMTDPSGAGSALIRRRPPSAAPSSANGARPASRGGSPDTSLHVGKAPVIRGHRRRTR